MSIELDNAKCQHCGAEVNAASHTSGRDVEPSVGDISICAYCQNFNIFTGDPDEPLAPVTRQEALSKIARVGCALCNFIGNTSEEVVMHMAETGHGVPDDMLEELRDGAVFGKVTEMIEAIRTGQMHPESGPLEPFSGAQEISVEKWDTLRMRKGIH